MSSDFTMLGNMYNEANLDQGGQEAAAAIQQINAQPAPHPLDQLRDMGARFAAQSEQEKLTGTPPFGSIKFNSDGTIDASGVPADVVRDLFQARDFQRQTLGGFAQQAQQIQTELKRAQSQPWQQLGTALAANMANQPGMPGWVRGLGQTAAQMNPTEDQLRAQYLGVLSQGSKIAQEITGGNLANAKFGLDVQTENRLARDAQMRQKLMFETEHVRAAIRGEGDPASVVALGVQSGIIPAEQAPAYQKNLEALRDSYYTKKTADEKRAFDNTVKVETLKAGIAAQKSAELFVQQDKLLSARIAATTAENDKKLAAQEARTTEKNKKPAPALEKQLSDLNAADNSLDEIEQLIKTPLAQKVMGPWTGTAAIVGMKMAPIFADPTGDLRGINSKLKLQTAQAIKATGAGARGFGPMERPFFENIAEALTNSPAQNQKILETWRQYLDQERRAFQVTYPDVDWAGKYAPALGKRFSGTVQQTAPVTPTVWTKEDIKKLREQQNAGQQ
jgi:hypothetical protein